MRYSGSCHCGAIKFEIDVDFEELTTCDCSLCSKKNALMGKVHESKFRLLAGEEQLAHYQWNTMTAHHHFCQVCGIYTFHRKRVTPDYFGINVKCLDDANLSHVPIRHSDGKSMSVESTKI